MFCSNCGNKLEKNFNFCNKCGTKIKKDSVFIEKKETEEKQSKVEIIDILLMLAPISTFMIYLTINTLKITGFLGIILGILIGIFFLILILLIQQLFSSVKHSLKNYHKNKENEKEKKYNQQSFTGADIIKNCDSKKTIAIKNSWNRFIVMFWIFFVIKTVILSNKSDPPNTLFYKQ